MTVQIELPDNFSVDAFLSFHRRDNAIVSEQITERTLQKAIMLNAKPVVLTFMFGNKTVQVSAKVAGSGPLVNKGALENESIEQLAIHMLGLRQSSGEFEHKFSDHPQVGELIQRQRGLRVPQTATPFEALSWAIIGQQISVAAAVSIRRRMIISAGQSLTGEALSHAYPDANDLLLLGHDGLRASGFSQNKAATMIRVCEGVVEYDFLPAHVSSQTEMQRVVDKLVAIKGIGPWTVSYALLRGYAWLDGSLHGDVAVRRNLQPFLSLDEPPSAKDTEKWLNQFSPWRALIAAHLWQSQSLSGF
ncbi:base excision DNA repair protein [Neptunomonas phycophila]|uniref:DNA-3-methyladenine glycosylase II n=1 Tax=Neptunomonas phycophila TaxID=1572645 RepID=A0ABT9EPG4_9GAMM|nr:MULTISPECIES: base excision DNA repair protein [Neptunomonas]MDN2659447.1 base excision DNA repair protein [Neptunomonas sp. CHC150]MDP2520958.1 base excision DNA repair protein [Neptunomonas phycophila]